MTPQFFLKKLYKQQFITTISSLILLVVSNSNADMSVDRLITEITKLPSTYYSDAAYAYFSSKGMTPPTQDAKTDAAKIFLAIIRLSAKETKIKEIISVLVASFPKAVHVTQVPNVRYNREGTFDDWAYTYVASEKNKFLLSSPFLDYNTMVLCEQFIEANYEITNARDEIITKPTRQPVTISVTHTLYPAAYTLTVLTGQQFGTDREKWQQWWSANRTTFTPSAVTASSPENASTFTPTGYGTLSSGQSFNAIIPKAKYRFNLKTGSILTGIVETKTDTSLIFECEDGKAYTFNPNLISSYTFIESPKEKNTAPSRTDSLPFSFDQLRGKPRSKKIIEVRVNSGMVFRGRLKAINAEKMLLDVGGSVITILRDVTLNIRYINTASTKKKKRSPKGQQTPPDTVYEKNSTLDAQGNPGPDLMHTGTITAVTSESVTIRLLKNNIEKVIPRSRLIRMIKHSANTYDSEIKRYAKPLFCPGDMFIVNVPPGKEGRPFFKVCVDRYEYPNVEGTEPKTNISYDEARIYCRKKGKRLCTSSEWQYACGGIENYTYPYGWNHDKNKCNTDDKRNPEPSGVRLNCVSKFGGYDMVGNVFEWVTDERNQPANMGGPHSKCQTITKGVGSSAKPRTGFRCCKSN